MIAEKRDRIARSRHRGFTICRACSACQSAMRARASPERSHLRGPGQPVPGSCPASPSAAAGLAVPPAITLQSLRRRHRRQFCGPQPWQLRARARRRHLTPRAGQRHQPFTARPNLPSPPPSPPVPPIKSHLSGTAPEAPRQALRPPVPPPYPPPHPPPPPLPRERLQGRGAAPEVPHQAVRPPVPTPYPPPLPPPPPPLPAWPAPIGIDGQ